MKKILLHACCAPCSPHVLEELKKDFEVTVYFFNPNIRPVEEYERRRNELAEYLRKKNCRLAEGGYLKDKWDDVAGRLKAEPEGGIRCEVCFSLRLNQTAFYAKKHGFDAFATTLTVSPHKKSSVINKIGRNYARDYEIEFVDRDFKKNDGYKISTIMSHEEGFYRQDYCGCVFSKRERTLKNAIKKEKARSAENQGQFCHYETPKGSKPSASPRGEQS